MKTEGEGTQLLPSPFLVQPLLLLLLSQYANTQTHTDTHTHTDWCLGGGGGGGGAHPPDNKGTHSGEGGSLQPGQESHVTNHPVSATSSLNSFSTSTGKLRISQSGGDRHRSVNCSRG